MSRINRVLILGALLLVAVAMTAQAFEPALSVQLGRLTTLGGGDALNSSYWADSEEVGQYPGSLNNYADIAVISFSPAAVGAMGFSLSKSESYGTYYVGLAGGTLDGIGNEMNNTTLGFGYALDAANIGLIYNRQSSNFTPAGGTETSSSQNTFTFGVDYEMDEDTNIDASFMFGSTGDETTNMGFMARAFYDWRDGVTAIPLVQYSNLESQVDFTTTTIALGLGFAYTVNESNDLVFGVNWQSLTMKNDTAAAVTSGTNTVAANSETSVTTMPGFYIGTQHEFTDWLELRAAATKNWTKTDPDGDAEMTDFPFAFSFGAGVAIGDWQVDMGLNTGWMYNVGYWFHGQGATVASPVASIQAKLFF